MKLSEEMKFEITEIDRTGNTGYHEVWKEQGTKPTLKKYIPKVEELEKENEELKEKLKCALMAISALSEKF
ncbi:MAG: hypothetical protein WC389_03605 [Lutibacter sp.]|jgi:hypothetical protein